MSNPNYHELLKTLIAVMDEDQGGGELFEDSSIMVFPDHIAFTWEHATGIELDAGALARSAATIGMKASVFAFGESLSVQLHPISQGGVK